ncbi:hypothetical protein FZEAL_9269, partial [Fusarium zealandicum]
RPAPLGLCKVTSHSIPALSEAVMEVPALEPDMPLQNPGDTPARPVRILVQTVTHLVPGNHYGERVEYMRNLICQHHWNRDFDWDQDRWNIHGNDFAIPNRNCYFLIDHGHSEPSEDPPVLWYKWMGESLIAMQQALPRKVQRKLRDYPFSRRPIQRVRSEPSGRFDAATHRQIIRTKLRCDMIIIEDDLRFLRAHPEDASWLKNHIEPQLWMKIQSSLELNQDGGNTCADRADTLKS